MGRSRWLAGVLAIAVALAAVGPAVGAAAPPSDGTGNHVEPSSAPVAAQAADNESGAGAAVASAIEGESARIGSGDLTARLESGLATAESDEQRAHVAGRVLGDALDRLDRLQRRRAALESDDSDPAAAARLRARAAELEVLAVRIDGTAADLPADLRADNGLTAERIDRLRTGAGRLAGDRHAFGPAFYANLSVMVDRYNERADTTGFIVGRLSGETVNLHVESGSETTVASFSIADDGHIEDVRAGARDDASIRMTTDKATIQEIAAADDPRVAFLAAIDRGDVTFRGLGPVDRIKWFAIGLLEGGADAVRGIVDTVRDLA